MEAIELNLEVPEPPQRAIFGERLVAAREARGLDLGDVVRVLRLPAATLQALESSCYEKLPAPVFVRGYLRAYARLLGMDAEALVAEYNRQVAVPEIVLAPAIKARPEAAARHLYSRGAFALIVLTVMMLLGSWWYHRPNQDMTDQSRIVSAQARDSAAPVTGLASPQAGKANMPPVSLNAHAPQPPAREAAQARVAAIESGTPPAGTPAVAVPALPATNTKADTVKHRKDAEARLQPTLPDLPLAPLASDHGGLVPASRAPTGIEAISIRANGESWAEVVDGNGYQLLYYLLRPGMEYRLQGQPPFQVFLGNAPAVELSLNHKPFDHTPFRRNNSTARFTVDAHP